MNGLTVLKAARSSGSVLSSQSLQPNSHHCISCVRQARFTVHLDIQHALIAKEANVNTFLTFDRGFDKLKQYFNNDYEIRVE